MGWVTKWWWHLAALVGALKLDLYTLLIIAAVIAAMLLPVRGDTAIAFTYATNAAIGLLFFLHGARLSRQAILAGLSHWRLHASVLALTFALFPLLTMAMRLGFDNWLSPELIAGIVFLGVLPSTIQSSVTYTAMARGAVPAAICSASLSNVIGVFLTPLLAALLIGAHGADSSLANVGAVIAQILLPFLAGHLLRPLIGAWLDRRAALLSWFDRAVILAVIYRAFSASMSQGLWSAISLAQIMTLLGIVIVLLAVVTFAAFTLAKALKFERADSAATVFCGSQKSLASGAPMASILFPAATVGAVLLPLMLYHQLQLILGAILARRFTQSGEPLERKP